VKLVTIKFKTPQGGSRKVNKFMQKVMDEVSDEVLMYESAESYTFPIYNGGETVGEVRIEEEPSTREEQIKENR
jgi:hypothetical protein